MAYNTEELYKMALKIVKEKKVRRSYLVECDSVTVAEAKVNAWVKDSPFVFETILVKQSKIVDVILDED